MGSDGKTEVNFAPIISQRDNLTQRHSMNPTSSKMAHVFGVAILCILLTSPSLQTGAAAGGIFGSDKPSSGMLKKKNRVYCISVQEVTWIVLFAVFNYRHCLP